MMLTPTKNKPPRRGWRFRLRTLLVVMAIVAVSIALGVWLFSPPRLGRAYFPIGVGYQWVYEAAPGDAAPEVVFEVVGKEKVGGTVCHVVERTIGDHQIRFYVEVNQRGAFIHQGEQDRYEPPYREFEFDSKRGDEWKWRGTIGGEPGEYTCWNYGRQPVEVPYGRLEAFSVHQETTTAGPTRDTSFWLAKGIGVVWIQSKERDKHDPPRESGVAEPFDWRLKAFTKP